MAKSPTKGATKNTARGAHPKTDSPIDKESLDAFLQIEDERKSLNRRVSVLEKQAAAHKEKFLEAVRAHGGPAKTVVAHGHRFTLHSLLGTVRWKDEFVRVAGAEAAEEIARSQPRRESLEVEPTDAE